MSNGDPLLVGLSQPPDNRAFSTTMLVQRIAAPGPLHLTPHHLPGRRNGK
jgi:hypothetical protein